MSAVYEFKLLELQVDHNGFSKEDLKKGSKKRSKKSLKKASNLFEVVLHYPNSENPKAVSLKSMNLWPKKEYLAESIKYYKKKLDEKNPPLEKVEKERLIQQFDEKMKIDAKLFKIAIEGKSTLEINVSIAKETTELEKILKKTFGVAISLASGAIPIVGSIISGLLAPAIDSIFGPSDKKKITSIGKAIIEFDEKIPMPLPYHITKEFVIQEDVDMTRFRSWDWTENGAKIRELEPGYQLEQGHLNGFVKLEINKI